MHLYMPMSSLYGLDSPKHVCIAYMYVQYIHISRSRRVAYVCAACAGDRQSQTATTTYHHHHHHAPVLCFFFFAWCTHLPYNSCLFISAMVELVENTLQMWDNQEHSKLMIFQICLCNNII